MKINATIRSISLHDDMANLTELIHSAYEKHAQNNLRYWATYQSVDDTVKRFSSGHGLVAEIDGRVVGTLTVNFPRPDSNVELYSNPFTWSLSQFAVLPEFQGSGIGHKLHEVALNHAHKNGNRIMALDTAANTTDLIAMYTHWGYKITGECDWRPYTNYLSVLMSRFIVEESNYNI